MNSIVLQGIALTQPETRRTADNSGSVASFLLEFPAPKDGDQPFRIKVEAWNKTGDRVMENLTQGDPVIVEGRVKLDTVDRGTHKEKRTTLIANDVHCRSKQTAPRVEAAFTDYVKTPVAAIAPKIATATANYDDICF